MDFFKKPLGKNEDDKKITCPRCLGKGHVDDVDIKRLRKELIWAPGDCAYCNKTGKINPDLETKVDVDEGYLTTELDKEEREKLINKDAEALKNAAKFNHDNKEFINQTVTLYTEHRLSVAQIVEFYLLRNIALAPETEAYEKEQKELTSYIKKVIEDSFPKN